MDIKCFIHGEEYRLADTYSITQQGGAMPLDAGLDGIIDTFVHTGVSVLHCGHLMARCQPGPV